MAKDRVKIFQLDNLLILSMTFNRVSKDGHKVRLGASSALYLNNPQHVPQNLAANFRAALKKEFIPAMSQFIDTLTSNLTKEQMMEQDPASFSDQEFLQKMQEQIGKLQVCMDEELFGFINRHEDLFKQPHKIDFDFVHKFV